MRAKNDLEIPENLALMLNDNKNACEVFTKMRPSCQQKYAMRAVSIANTAGESSKMENVAGEIIRYGKKHGWL